MTNKKFKQVVQESTRRSILLLANPEVTAEEIWEDLSRGVDNTPTDQAFDADARAKFFKAAEDEKILELVRLKTLITRCAMLASVLTDESPSMILGVFAGELMVGEIDATADFIENIRNN